MNNDIINRFESHHNEVVAPAYTELRRLNLENISSDATTRRMYAYKAHAAGRYEATEEERKSGVHCIVEVPLTDEEKLALTAYRNAVDKSNEMYDEYKRAKMVKGLLSGKRMQSRYDGKSSLTDEPFAAGTEIYYARTLKFGTLVAPVSEVE